MRGPSSNWLSEMERVAPKSILSRLFMARQGQVFRPDLRVIARLSWQDDARCTAARCMEIETDRGER